MLRLQVQASTQDLDRLFIRLGEALNTEEILDEAGALLLNRIRTRFLAETDPDGNKWIPSKAGLKRKAGGFTYRNGTRYTATGTLFETGKLFHSIQLSPGGVGERVISTDVPYAVELQEGRGARGIATKVGPSFSPEQPPRVFLGFGDEDTQLVEVLLIRRVQQFLGA